MKKIYEYEAGIKELKYKIWLRKSILNEMLQLNRKWLFRLMDFMFICFILFNFGAVLITNLMVVKNAPADHEFEFREVNPVAAKLHGYEIHPDAMDLIKDVAKQALIWVVLCIGYWHFRFRVSTPAGLYIMLGIVTFYFLVLGWDFCNDLGLLIGILTRGG